MLTENLQLLKDSYCVGSFRIVMGACITIHKQQTVIVEMTMMLKRLMTMALQMYNKNGFVYVILTDSVIYTFNIKCIFKHVLFLFLTDLYDLLGC